MKINRSSIIVWNYKNPLDRWWREKHGISFGSKTHLETNVADQLFEYLEDKIYKEAIDERKNPYIVGQWIEDVKVDKTTEDKLFDLI